METDVTKAIDETMDEGRYRGFDLDEEIEVDLKDENETEETTSGIGNNDGKSTQRQLFHFCREELKTKRKR